MTLEFVMQVFFNGLMLSSFYALMAVGLTLVFGVMRVINFAHGELYMLGAYLVWLLVAQRHLPFFVSVVIAMLAISALAVIIERALFKPLRGNQLSIFIMSIAIVFILQVSALSFFGVRDKFIPTAFEETIRAFGAVIPTQRLIIIPVAAALFTFLWLFLKRTRHGQALRACTQDSEGASLQGISFNMVFSLSMAISGAFAGAAAAFIGPLVVVNPYMGAAVIWKAFIVVIVGGLGSIQGTILAALLFGYLDSTVSSLIDAPFANLLGVLIMLLILALKPQGLLGRGEEREA